MKPILSRLLAGLGLAALLAACATPPAIVPLPDEKLFADDSFGPPSQSISADAVMALNASMRHYLDEQIAPRLRRQIARDALLEALYTRSELQLRYDSDVTRTASEAFDARAGNCLSLVLMTAAFAEQMGLPYHFRSVQVDETWGREGNLVMFMGHVNIALGRRSNSLQPSHLLQDDLVVDFLPTADLRRQVARPIDKTRVLALYMNNRAAEALAQGKLDDAYWWARAAITQDRELAIAYNTLGVVYLRHGQAALADTALRQALSLEPDSRHALGNLVQVLDLQGRGAESLALSERLRHLQVSTAYGQYELGTAALRRGQYAESQQHFDRAVRMDPERHEFHFSLAQALVSQGLYEAGARELAAARELTSNQQLRQTYAGKLQRLREQLTH